MKLIKGVCVYLLTLFQYTSNLSFPNTLWSYIDISNSIYLHSYWMITIGTFWNFFKQHLSFCICLTISTAFFSIKASSDKNSSFRVHQCNSVEAKICEIVPIRWKSMAINWIKIMAKKKKTRTIPMGSKCRYSFVIIT